MVIFTAAANVNGASIRTASLVSGNIAEGRLQADWPDGTHRVLLDVNTETGSGSSVSLPYPLLLPPGVGLSFGTVGSNPSEVFVTYDLH